MCICFSDCTQSQAEHRAGANRPPSKKAGTLPNPFLGDEGLSVDMRFFCPKLRARIACIQEASQGISNLGYPCSI